MKEKNFKIIYDELVELHKNQQEVIKLTSNKLNWILVSDVVLLAFIYSTNSPNIAVIILLSLSAILSLFGFSPRKFKITEKISDQINRVEDENFLEKLVNKKREAYNSNEGRERSMNETMFNSQILLIIALVLQFLLIALQITN